MTLLLSMPGTSEWIIIIIFFVIPTIFYLLTLQNTLNLIGLKNRKMPTRNLWLLLIPLFGTIWHFFIVKNMADSLKAEFSSRNIKTNEDRPAYGIGIVMCISQCFMVIPLINSIAGIVFLVCWIVYWIKISSYKKLLMSNSN